MQAREHVAALVAEVGTLKTQTQISEKHRALEVISEALDGIATGLRLMLKKTS